MEYTEITITTDHDSVDPLSLILTDLGIAGFAVSDPADFAEFLQKEHDYDWDYIDEALTPKEDDPVCITIHIEDTVEGLDLLERVLDEIRACNIEKIELKSVCDDDWKDNWKAYFKPAKISDTIVVKPSWEAYVAKDQTEKVIELDPGMAFGTGTHPTTSLCVELMETYLKTGDAVLDVGCGSGILSIAAQKLGAGSVLGVDIDPIAVQVSLENVALNRASDVVDIRFGDLTKGISFEADLVAANLMADLVILLSKDVAKHIKPGGIFISSGILVEKKSLVSDAICEAGFAILEAPEREEWCAIAAKRL